MTDKQSLHLYSADDSSIQPRRLPVQARSRERVERILDAAAQLLTEQGYNSVKTNTIAKRAGVPIGSVYQFFPNRYAIFNALASRYQTRVAEILSESLSPDALQDTPWDEALASVIDVLATMWREDWAFHSVWLAIQNTAELQEADLLFREEVIDSILVAFLKRVIPGIDEHQQQTIARIMFETTNLLLDNSMRRNAKQDELLVDELKFLLHSYLSAHLTSASNLSDEPPY
ncbi:MAG: TetR/AcrR family transcriptional regulator [Candidatus Hydrogenedentota bacterium]